jgi:PH-interacting protein
MTVQGLTSLLAPGRLSPLSLPQLHPSPHPHSAATPQAAQLHPGTGAQRTSQAGPLALLSRTHGETNAVGLGLPPAFKPWAVPPHSSAPRMASLMLRSLGVCCAPRAAGGSAAGVRPGSLHSTEMLGRSIRHVRTLRGHKLAVYCLAYTRDGRYIVSGSDDWLVKVCTCLGAASKCAYRYRPSCNRRVLVGSPCCWR